MRNACLLNEQHILRRNLKSRKLATRTKWNSGEGIRGILRVLGYIDNAVYSQSKLEGSIGGIQLEFERPVIFTGPFPEKRVKRGERKICSSAGDK